MLLSKDKNVLFLDLHLRSVQFKSNKLSHSNTFILFPFRRSEVCISLLQIFFSISSQKV